MAEIVSEDLNNVLKLLGLKHFYPEKLSRDNLYQITSENFTDLEEIELKQASRQFINKITRYNYNARNIQSEDTENMETSMSARMGYRERARRKKDIQTSAIHPLEVIASVYLCCDPTARQDLVMHLWGCKLAIPLLLQLSKDTKPHVFIWPMRSLIGQFQTDSGLVEMPLISMPMKSIAVMRVGQNDEISKSFLLNSLIGGPEKAHPIFFHRNSEGSKRNKTTVTEGMIEIAWFLSTESVNDKFSGPRLFINVRGNSEYLEQQKKFIGQLATVTLVLTTVSRLENTVTTVKNLLKYGSHVILLLSDNVPDGEAIDKFLETYFDGVPDTKFDIVTTEGYMLSGLLKTLTYNIKKMEDHNDRKIQLGDFAKNLTSMEYNVDEAHPQYVEAFEVINDIVSNIRDTDGMDRKQQLLPLQEKYWKRWSQIDRDVWRFDQLETSEQKKHVSKANLEVKLAKTRKLQYQHISKKGLSKVMSLFITTLFTCDKYKRMIFLRMLKLELDNLSRNQLRPLDREYQDLVNQTINASEEDRAVINQKLSDIDEIKVKVSFGLEHMIREMGQIFEACESQPETVIYIVSTAVAKIQYTELLKLACYLLLEGYPVEILDGEACSVPILWVKNVLNCLPAVLQENNVTGSQDDNIKVHVVSVLGIQSSGKSTFLNTIFGLQFAVSAGRCTRGAFMQGVIVHPSMKEQLGADYVLAIDTEGLKAAELISDYSIKHDNELSTFVIGLADTTIINLMGENATYLQENLPIAVHAFLRMNLAGLHPRCTIVHHNVDKRNKEKLLVQGRILESVLNKLTKKACELENIPHRLFQDIIEFSITRHTDYIPALFEGEQPMAPISVGYSKESENVREKVIEFVRNDIESSSLSHFARHIETLWNAIKKDKFVYEFRTTLEAEARLELDQKYSSILLKYLTDLDNIVDTLTPKLMSKKQTCTQVEEKFLHCISSVEKKCRNEMENFMAKRKRFATSCYEQWKDKCLSNLDDEMKHHRNSALQQFRDHVDQLSFSISMDKIESFFSLVREKSISFKKSEEECFDIAWTEWAISTNLIKRNVSVVRDTAKALQNVCQSHKHLLAESTIENKSLKDFIPSTERHLNHSFHKFSEKAILDLRARMKSIKILVEHEYGIEVNNITQKKMPYSDRHPKQILLRVGHRLSERLSNEDKSNETANQFKIDLLIYTAGSIVKDLRDVAESDTMLSPIKQNMKELLLIKTDKANKATDELIKVFFVILQHKLQCEFPSFAPRCIKEALEKSEWKSRIKSKQLLLGSCLNHAIVWGKDEMLSEYLTSPRKAVFTYLQILLKRVISTNQFVPVLQKITEGFACQLRTVLEQETAVDISVEEIVVQLLRCAELNDNIDQLERYRIRAYRREKVNLTVVSDSLTKKFQHLIVESVERLEQVILKDQESIILTCADKLCSQLIGCEAVCPLCNEICKYSSRHSSVSKHECFVHRPVGCRGIHKSKSGELSYETCAQHFDQDSVFKHYGKYINFKQFQSIYPDWSLAAVDQKQPSLIWKWIFLNKNSSLDWSRKLKLPRNIPENWKVINKKEVLREIKDQFLSSLLVTYYQ